MQYHIEVTSASEVTTLWHYTNMFIIIIIIIIVVVFCDHFVLHSVSVKKTTLMSDAMTSTCINRCW